MSEESKLKARDLTHALERRLRGRATLNADAMNYSAGDTRRMLVVGSNEPFEVGDTVRVVIHGSRCVDAEAEVEELAGLTGIILTEDLPAVERGFERSFVEELPAPLRDYLPEDHPVRWKSWDELGLFRQCHHLSADQYPLWAVNPLGVRCEGNPGEGARVEQHTYFLTVSFRLASTSAPDAVLDCAEKTFDALAADTYLDGLCWSFRVFNTALRLDQRGACFVVEARRAAVREGGRRR
jgi:hypothetical protein